MLKAVREVLQRLPGLAGHSAQVVCAFFVSSPVQGGLVVLNLILVKSGQ